MDQTRRAPVRERAEDRFAFEEWLGAVLALAAILAGATAAIGLAYWLVFPR